MTDTLRFEPLLPAHAIERCGVTVVFNEPLPEKIYEKVIGDITPVLRHRSLQQLSRKAFAVNVDLATGKIVPTSGLGPVSFAVADESTQLHLFPNAVLWQSTRDVRWAPFIAQFEALAGPVVERFLESVSASAVKLEYWDRFFWSGDWNDLDVSLLLREDSGLKSGLVSRAGREWHNHIGWFEPSDGFRRLINVNVDVVEARSPMLVDARPSIGIYSMMQDETNVKGYGETPLEESDQSFIFRCLCSLHDASKKLLSDVITDGMARRIGLDLEDDA